MSCPRRVSDAINGEPGLQGLFDLGPSAAHHYGTALHQLLAAQFRELGIAADARRRRDQGRELARALGWTSVVYFDGDIVAGTKPDTQT